MISEISLRKTFNKLWWWNFTEQYKNKVSNENINLKNDENDNVVSRVIEVFDGEILR